MHKADVGGYFGEEFPFLVGIGFDLLLELLRFEFDKIDLAIFDKIPDGHLSLIWTGGGGQRLSDKTVGIVTIGQDNDPKAGLFRQERRYVFYRSFDPSGIGIEQQHDVFCEAFDQPDLLDGQGRAAWGNRVFKTDLPHLQDIVLSFHDVAFVGLVDLHLGMEKAKQQFRLFEQFIFGAVFVLGLHLFGQGPPSKPADVAAYVVDRIGDPTCKEPTRSIAKGPFVNGFLFDPPAGQIVRCGTVLFQSLTKGFVVFVQHRKSVFPAFGRCKFFR